MIFISYSSKDEKITREIKGVLEGAGYECWMAPESISAGEDYADAIPRGIDSCHAFLLVLSENSLKSRFVKKELDRAISKDKYVIPAKIGQCQLTTGFEFLLSDTQIIDISSPFSQILAAIGNHGGPISKTTKKSDKPLVNKKTVAPKPKATDTLQFSGGNWFVGEVIDGKIGRYGTYHFATGARYEGEFLNGNFHGKGTYYWTDGGTYSGDWVNGVQHGYGVKTWDPNGQWGKDRYEGEYRNGKFNGQGTYTWGDGRKYVGNWVNDVREGYGVFTWAPGSQWEHDKYEGQFKDGKFNGQGTYTWGDGRKYVGNWVNDSREGYGVFTWAPGSQWSADKYEGQFKGGKFNGQGTYTWADGRKYVGNWVNDSREGYGVFTWAPGSQWANDRYEGQFKGGMFNGQGTYYFGDGRIWKGLWKDDQFVGKK